MSSLTQTFVIHYNGKFLMVRRSLNEKHFPGYWAFPGGKVKPGEIPLESAIREIKEETNLDLEDKYIILDSYGFADRSAYAFLFFATSDKVILNDENTEFEWIGTIEDLKSRKCIPGIYYHFFQAVDAIKNFKILLDFSLLENELDKLGLETQKEKLQKLVDDKKEQIKNIGVFRSIEKDLLSEDKYPNK